MRLTGLFVLVLVLVAGCSGPAKPKAADPAPAGPAAPSADASPAPVSPSAGPADPSGATATAPPPLSSTVLPTIGPARPPKRPTDNIKPIIASGRVRVTPGCVDLVTNSVIWTMLGGPVKALKDGDQVQVTGLPGIQIETACSGSPLAVLTAKKI